MQRYFQLFKEAWTEFGNDKAQRLGAALAYYTLFAITPVLLIAITIAGLTLAEPQRAVAPATTQRGGAIKPRSQELSSSRSNQ